MTTHQARVADFGSSKIWAIKLVRALSGVGLKEAKELTERGGTFTVRVDPRIRAELEEAAGRGIRIIFDPPLDGSPPAPEPPRATSSTGRFALRYLTGPKKIAAIKLVRELSGCGLKEAKDLVEQQGTIAFDRSRAEAEAITRQFEAIGSQVELLADDGGEVVARGPGGDYDDGLDF